MVYLNWKQKYDDQIQGSQLMSSDTLSLISFFEHEVISSKEYLLWAQQECLLPIIRDEFFEHFSHQDAIELVGKYEDLKDYWSPVCIPIGEWDGHLIIAGSFFSHIETQHPIIPFLTSFSNTRVVWDFLHLHLSDSSYHAEPPQILDRSQWKDELETKSVEENSLEDTKKFFLNGVNGLEETNPGEAPFLQSETQLIENKTTGRPSLPELKIPTQYETFELQEEVPQEPVTIEALKESSESIPNSATHGQPEGIDFNISPIPSTGFENLSEPRISVDEITNIDYKINNQDSWDSVRTHWGEIQDEMSTFFDRTVLVSINSELENFTEVIWSTSVNPVHLGLSLTLKEPSIFRVVYTTFKPYHGHIVSNPVNQSFFENWNDNEIPAHVSIAPIIINQNLKGLLIGIGNISAYTNNALSLAEKMSEKISEYLKNSNSSKAA